MGDASDAACQGQLQPNLAVNAFWTDPVWCRARREGRLVELKRDNRSEAVVVKAPFRSARRVSLFARAAVPD